MNWHLYNNLEGLRENTKILSHCSRYPAEMYVVRSKSFRSDMQKPRQMENAVRDI